MIISHIFINNFGPLKECDVQLKNGLNIITGSNASGKTQLFGAIVLCFFGPKVLKIDKSSQLESCIRLAYENDKYKQIVEYTYLNNKQLLKTFIDQRNAFIYDFPIYNYDNLFNKYKPLFISDTALLKELPTKQDLDYVTDIINNEISLRNTWNRIKKIYESQINGVNNKKIVISSMGEEWLLKLIKMVLMHSQDESPIIIDEAFIYLDKEMIAFVLGLLEILSHNKQIILFSSPIYVEAKNIIYSLPSQIYTPSSIAYNYEFTGKILLLSGDKEVPKKNQVNPQIIRYIFNTQIQDEEYRQVEFKEIKGKNPIDTIKNVVDEYIVAFLNDYSDYTGRIIWGVTNNDRRIVGVKLDYSQRDNLRRVITEKLGKINPSIPPSSYKVLIEPVYDSEKNQIQDLYIVEVLVETTRSKLLYATAGNEVFIKTDGGKKKLTPIEIQQEALRRKGA